MSRPRVCPLALVALVALVVLIGLHEPALGWPAALVGAVVLARTQ